MKQYCDENGKINDDYCIDFYKEHLFQLAKGIEELKKHCSLPVSIENDANCAALAEVFAGAGKGYEDFVEQIYDKIDEILEKVKIADLKPKISKCSYGPDANLAGALVHYLQGQNK